MSGRDRSRQYYSPPNRAVPVPVPTPDQQQEYYGEGDEQEIIVFSPFDRLLNAIKLYIFRPFFMGASGAFGISVGYATYDYVIKRWWSS